ncbi:CMGC kinase [Fusarium mundagurra]|uniref:CMGC kinase n=1 Tax=Fusarium mundagurra TaxID=1567541 RepID=A0A8H5XXC0_9HYPO|nr:CMGC kinase [Fusarium mundagurra]
MNRVPTTDSPPNGSTRPAPLIEEPISQERDAQDWGDFVDSGEEPDVEFACEDINLYPRGVCYPISIGEVIIERYHIVHKLGHGAFSTVWMAYVMVENKDVALKILMLGNSDERDYQMQSEIIGTAKDLTYLLVYHQTFLLPSPHGQHRVIVFPIQGPNLRNHPPRKTPIVTRLAFAVQLLKALKALHQAGIVHADLNTANIMYTLRPLNSSISEKYKQLGRPRKMKLWTEQWKDGELVMPMNPQEELIGDSIVLGDFGLAHKVGTSTHKMQSPATYCAPERVHNINPSYGSDMWSYTCIFFELYTGTHLFQGWGHASVVSSMVRTLGPLPVSWKGTYHVGGSGEDEWYDQNGQIDPDFDLKERITQLRPDVGATELELVVTILRRGLVYQHEERITAAELMEHDSFKEFMSIYTQQHENESQDLS